MQSNAESRLPINPAQSAARLRKRREKVLFKMVRFFSERVIDCALCKSRYLESSLTCGIPGEMQSNAGSRLPINPARSAARLRKRAGKSLIQAGPAFLFRESD
ncbi:hypothetical protein CEXT_794151 [Caerostris extrusa]|uniref:Uncharacterized protein n=1 Tax=Caerostris extrusa TaxID=172846 RepID=A0AAV4SQV9_CAEEX|nr:hypothetical protein CEXT_794151 [Caerostris extrusa]